MCHTEPLVLLQEKEKGRHLLSSIERFSDQQLPTLLLSPHRRSDGLVLNFQWAHERIVHILHLLPLSSTSSVSLTGRTRTGSVPVGARDHEAHVVHPPASHHALGQLCRGVCGVKRRDLK